MKKLLLPLLLLIALFCLSAACAEEPVDLFQEVTFNATAETASAEQPIILRGVDFSDGAGLLRFRAETEGEMTINVYIDSMDSAPVASARFRHVNKENRRTVSLSGVHDVYIVVSGSGTFTTLQAFADQQALEAALRASSGEDSIPGRYTKDCPNGGTVEKFTYEAHDYANDLAVYEKAAYVYLPLGYDPESTYDLLILCHGIGGNEAEWGLGSNSSRVKQIMDNLIDGGEILPFIIVTPNGRAGKTSDYSAFDSVDRELREDLLPALAEAYAVDITDRNRCAMAGLSMGGMQTINLGIGRCLDLFSAFGAFSAAPTSNPASVTAEVLNGQKDLPVRIFYSICGTEDGIALASAKAAVEGLESMTDRLDGKNFIVQYVPGGHDFTVWYLGFYNFARLIAGVQ